MKIINFEIKEIKNNKCIPADYLLTLCDIFAKTESPVILSFRNCESGAFFYKATKNLINFFQISNVSTSINDIDIPNPTIVNDKKTFWFSPTLDAKELSNVDFGFISSFLEKFEKTFKTLPFFTTQNKNIEKIMFINVILFESNTAFISH